MLNYTKMHDQALFDLVKLQDDVSAFKEIYERYFSILYVHAYKRLHNREEAQDVVQEVFTTFWNKRSDISLTSNLPAYLYTAVRNRIFNIISHQQVESIYIQSIQNYINQGICQTDHLVRENDLLELIEKEIAALPSKMQEVFELSRKRYLSHKEIAVKLNVSEQTVKKQVNNALRILRTKLSLYLFILFFFH